MAESLLRPLGLIGGMSWQSTQIYYAHINTAVNARLGGNHSAPLFLYSYDFAEIEALQEAGHWEQAGKNLADMARRLEDAGAEAIVICTNTMHKLTRYVEDEISIPLLHIVDATASAILASEAQDCLLLATRYTMAQDFYKGPLADKIATDNRRLHIPSEAACEIVHDVIYEELCRGIIRPQSRKAYLDIIGQAADEFGVDGVILGCTEIGMLIGAQDTELAVFDTTSLHCKAATDFICADVE